MKRSLLMILPMFLTFSVAAQDEHAIPADSSALLAFSAVSPAGEAQDTTRKPPADFVEVDTPPSVVTRVEPTYPELALRAGMEGKVWVKIWIDSAGVVRDVVVLKSDADIFNAPSVEAARKFKFAPARIGTRPVDVWVSLPFKFTIGNKVDSARQTTNWKSPADKNFHESITALLQGGKIPSHFFAAFVDSHATAIAGGRLKNLRDVIEEQQAGKHSLEEAGRKVAYSTSLAPGDAGISYLVFRTEVPGKTANVHYHTVVFRRSPDGIPQIIHWHAWHASR